MSALKNIIVLSCTLPLTLATMVAPVLAATEERVPPGTLAVRIFLGFCALIIVAQLFPLLRQIVRSLSGKKARAVEAEVRDQ